MKRILFILLFLLSVPLYSQVLTGYRIKFSPTDNFSFPAVGQFVSPEAKHDTLYFIDNGTHHIIYPQSGGSGGSFISTIIDSPDVWVTLHKSGDTIIITRIDSAAKAHYADSSGKSHLADSSINSHKADTLYNIYQNVWERTSGGIVTLVHAGDSTVVGGSFDASLVSKLQIPSSNTLMALAFTQPIAASADAALMWGRMNNDDLWRIEHLGGSDSWRLEYVQNPGGTTPTYLAMNPTGFGIDGVATDAFHVYGNMTLGTTAGGAMSGSGNLRVRGNSYLGVQAAETNTMPNHVAEITTSANDIFTFTNSALPDSTTGATLNIKTNNLAPFTSASAQTILSYPLNWNTTYSFEMTVIMKPTGKTGEYFSKKIFVTASNDSGTVVFDTTTIASQLRDPFSVFGTCDFVVTNSGNNLVFQVKGSATRETHFIMYGYRSYTK